jgi:ketosteroid isomerase-like protein
MKKIQILTFFLTTMILFSSSSLAQASKETQIRTLENAQREAFLKKDTTALYKLFSPTFVVNAPTNKITTLQELKQLIRNGKVDLESFDRVTEKVTFTGDIAIAMGNETLRPTGKMPNAGKTVKRRYTNIWIKNGNSWRLTARQATIISVE